MVEGQPQSTDLDSSQPQERKTIWMDWEWSTQQQGRSHMGSSRFIRICHKRWKLALVIQEMIMKGQNPKLLGSQTMWLYCIFNFSLSVMSKFLWLPSLVNPICGLKKRVLPLVSGFNFVLIPNLTMVIKCCCWYDATQSECCVSLHLCDKINVILYHTFIWSPPPIL